MGSSGLTNFLKHSLKLVGVINWADDTCYYIYIPGLYIIFCYNISIYFVGYIS